MAFDQNGAKNKLSNFYSKQVVGSGNLVLVEP